MSSGSHDIPATLDHHDHAFDGEPIEVLPADEPRTPGWVPALGAVLFVSAAVAFLATRETSAHPTEPAPQRAAVAIETAAAPIRPAPVAAPAPAQSGPADALRRLSPEQIKALQKQIEGMKAKQAAAGAPPARP